MSEEKRGFCAILGLNPEFFAQVVNGAVRQLQHIVCDDIPSHCTSTYLNEARKGSTGGPIASTHRRLHLEQAYQKKIEKLLQDENCFKMFTVSSFIFVGPEHRFSLPKSASPVATNPLLARGDS